VAFVTRGQRGGGIAPAHPPEPVPDRLSVPSAQLRLPVTPPQATWPPHWADGCGRVGLAAALGPESGRQAIPLERTAGTEPTQWPL
jgi:hypothetical protein